MSHVQLRFLLPSGGPAAALLVTVVQPSGAIAGRVRTNLDGAAALPLRDDGTVVYLLGDPPGAPVRWRPGDGESVTVPSRADDHVRLVGRLVDRHGQPAPGVGVALAARDQGRTLATSASDSNGLFSLSFPAVRADEPEDRYVLDLSVNEKPVPLPGLRGRRPGLFGPLHFVVDKQAASGSRVAPTPLPVRDEGELLDLLREHPALAVPPVRAAKPDPCNPHGSLDFPARVFHLEGLSLLPGVIDDGDDPPRLMGRRDARGVATRFGALLEFRQEWWDLGYGLGDLLYSVPLAPCEQVKLATIDWRRRDWARTSTAVDERHFQDATITRDETIGETVHMTAAKGTVGVTHGGGAAISLGLLNLGSSFAVQAAGELTDATTTAARSVNDRIQQASTTLRSTRAYAITEVTQQETTSVATRTVRNHNHSHTLTFQYFEVIRRFRVATKPVRVRPVLFVEFPLLRFDETALGQHGYLIRRALLDPTLAPLLDRYLAGETGMPGGGGAGGDGAPDASQPPEAPADETSAVLRYFEVRTSGWDLNPARLIVNDRIATLGAGPATTDGRRTASLMASVVGVDSLGQLRKIGLEVATSAKDNSITLDDFEIVAVMQDDTERVLLRRASVTLAPGRRVVDHFAEAAPAPAAPATPGAGSAPPSAPLDLRRLFMHLTAYRAYYSATVHSAGDPGLRWLALNAMAGPGGARLADVVDNVVVGSVGNMLAFPLTRPDLLPDDLRQLEFGDLVSHADERLLTLPSPGVFAEAQLGTCSASEKIDNTRFWQWHLAPCPDEAPDITDAMTGSRYRDPAGLLRPVQSTLTPSPVQIPELPKPMIQIGDATLAALVKDLQLPDATAVLSLVDGLTKTSAEGFRQIVDVLVEYGSKAALASAGMPDVAGLAGAAGGVAGAGEALGGLASTTAVPPI